MLQRSLRVCSLTSRLLPYGASLDLQERLVAHRKAGTVGDTLLIVQHSPVYTIGKRGSDGDFHTDIEALLAAGAEVARVPRGGETTYHGPGQLVAYPILSLRQLGMGARAYVEALEDAMVQVAGGFGVQARGRVPGKTGVWVGERKLGAVGVRIAHGVCSHGLALNVLTDLSAYRHIVPCGSPDKEPTSLQRELLRAGAAEAAGAARPPRVGMADAEEALAAALARTLGFGELRAVGEADVAPEGEPAGAGAAAAAAASGGR